MAQQTNQPMCECGRERSLWNDHRCCDCYNAAARAAHQAKLATLRDACRDLCKLCPDRMVDIRNNTAGRRGAPLHIIACELGFLATWIMGDEVGSRWERKWDLHTMPRP